MIETLRSFPTVALPIVFALVWLAAVLMTDRLKDAKGKATRAMLSLGIHCAMWGLGVLYVVSARVF